MKRAWALEHLTQARNSLGAVVKRGHLGKTYVILEKDGIPLATMMDVDEFEDYLELHDPRVRAIIPKGTDEYRAGKSRPGQLHLSVISERLSPPRCVDFSSPCAG